MRSKLRYWRDCLFPIDYYRRDEWNDDLIIRIGRPRWPRKRKTLPAGERVVNMAQIISSIDVSGPGFTTLLGKLNEASPDSLG